VLLVVGVGVVAGVPVDPPLVAHADQAAVHRADRVVGAAGPEDLPMSGVVPDEGQLREHDRQGGGDEQLPPAVAEEREADSGAGEGQQRAGDLECVAAVPAPQQPGGAYLAGQCRVFAARQRRGQGRGRLTGAVKRIGRARSSEVVRVAGSAVAMWLKATGVTVGSCEPG
jgi:hypothetical protein